MSRSNKNLRYDDNRMLRNDVKIQSEVSFNQVSQQVEKNEIDIFKTLLDKQTSKVDIHFIGTLHKFNLPIIENSWNEM